MSEVTFAHHTAAVNNVQLHYVTAGRETRSSCSTAGPRPGTSGEKSFLPWPGTTPLLRPICAAWATRPNR